MRGRGGIRAAAGASLLAAITLAALLQAGAAVEATSPPDPPTRPGAEPIVLALDVSGSMNAAVGATGGTRWDHATTAVVGIVEQLPIGTPVGLRVFGHASPDAPDVRCAATELVVPVAPASRSHVDAAADRLAGLAPLGDTPIGASLAALAHDLPEGGRAVLVSDGEDTCSPPGPEPCAAAAALEGLRVDTIGFLLDSPEGSRQLRCIADATGGTHRDARDAGALMAALRAHVLGGEPVTGGERPADAPLLGGGRYLDTLPYGAGRWYAVDLAWGTVLGTTVTAAAAGPVPADAEPRLAVEVGASDMIGTVRCVGDEVRAGSAPAPMQARVEGPRVGADGPCSHPGRYLIQVVVAAPAGPAPSGEAAADPPAFAVELVLSMATDPEAPPSPEPAPSPPRPPVESIDAPAEPADGPPAGRLVVGGLAGLALGVLGGGSLARRLGP